LRCAFDGSAKAQQVNTAAVTPVTVVIATGNTFQQILAASTDNNRFRSRYKTTTRRIAAGCSSGNRFGDQGNFNASLVRWVLHEIFPLHSIECYSSDLRNVI